MRYNKVLRADRQYCFADNESHTVLSPTDVASLLAWVDEKKKLPRQNAENKEEKRTFIVSMQTVNC